VAEMVILAQGTGLKTIGRGDNGLA
jgi:hypothetical protein